MWELNKILLITLMVFCVKQNSGQDNIQTRVPAQLMDCYRDREIHERDLRLPSNINMLIELIRRIEDSPGFNMDMRQLAVTLLHRFRLDGIERAPGVFQASVLPFSPSGFQFSKHRILLTRLISGPGGVIANETLTMTERCTLHFMLSSSIDREVRGDENVRCNQLAPLRAMRLARVNTKVAPIRKRRSVPTKNNFLGDVELMEELKEYQSRKKSGRMQNIDDENTATEIEGADEDEENTENTPNVLGDDEYVDEVNIRDVGLIDGSNVLLSQCPVENGVIRTNWGAVAAGPLIAGIAAGLQQQFVTTRDLLALSKSSGDYRARQTQVLTVDNRWAATLAGDLAEVALLQGPVTQQVQVGAPGGWNSTAIPRWHFLSQRERLELTDAEIRGGLDGLILSLNVDQYRSRAPMMRLSQLLDMYYSQRGVFSTNIRSCNRRALFTEVASLEAMQAQTAAFSAVLDREMQLRVTLPHEAIQQFSNAAASSLSTYIPQSLNDPTCATTSIVPNDQTIWRSSTTIFIYVDTAWTFAQLQPVVATLLENLDVNPFASRYIIMNANNVNVMVDTSQALSNFYLQWNAQLHQQQPNGLNLPEVLRDVRNRTRAQLDAERTNSTLSLQSMVLLIIPHTAAVNEADTNFALEQIQIIREEVPDLHMLFLAGGTPGRFQRFVRDGNRDIFPLQISEVAGGNVLATVNPVIERVQQFGRRIINPRCGANWQSNEGGDNTQNDYVERSGVIFYRIHPNYFFLNGENRRVRIQGHGYGTITVCHSRMVERPRQAIQTPENDINCRQLISDSLDVNLNTACEGNFLIRDCLPLFISVEGTNATADSLRCTERECRHPDMLRFSINANNLGCFSGVGRLTSIFLLTVLSVLFVLKV